MVHHMIIYNCKEDKPMIEKIKKAVETVKELQKLVAQLEKLTIQIVSIVGWILILIHLFE